MEVQFSVQEVVILTWIQSDLDILPRLFQF